MNWLYLGRRLLFSAITVWFVLTVVFAMVNVVPGSAADILLSQQATEENVEQVEEELGLNEPLHERYIDWMGGVVTGDWGDSLITKQPVLSMVIPRTIRTFQLALATLLLVSVLAIPAGVLAAAMRDTLVDSVISSLAYIGVSIPSFVTATILIILFTQPPLELFPSGGYVPLSEGVIPWLHHMALPIISLTIILVAHVLRQTRGSMIESLQSEYVWTARLKGVSEVKVLFFHALRNGLLPTITVLAFNFGWLLGSLVIVEQIFRYPGLGQLLVEAISDRDMPLIQAAIIIPTVGYIAANLLADLLYTALDPRINLGE